MNSTTYGVEVEATEPRMRHEMFVADVRGVELAFQVYHLEDQLYVYIGGKEGNLTQCAFGVRVRGGLGGGGVATTTLIGSEAGARASSDSARRLAMKSGKSIVISVNMPEGCEELQGEAERVLVRYLRENGALEKDMKELERALNGL